MQAAGPADRAQHDRDLLRRGAQRARGLRPAADHPPGVHARRPRRRHRPHRGGLRADRRAGPRRVADRPDPDRRVDPRLGRVRARGHARPRGQRRDRLLDREHRPDGRPHRRLRHGRAAADADRPHLPEAARPGDRRDPRRRRRDRRLQRAVRGQPGDRRDHRHRDEPARVARRRALASKATGFPIAKIAARLAVGYTLDEIPNDITRATPASFEPTLDYVVVKWPRFAFEKFPGVDATLSTHMKSVGEVMAIGRTFGQAFGKALRSRELDAQPSLEGSDEELLTRLESPSADRYDVLLELQQRGVGRRRDPRPHGHRPLVPARAAQPRDRVRRRPHLQGRRHLRGRVRGRDAVLLLRLGDELGRVRGPARRQAERDDPRLGPEPDRPGHRVRLLLRARRDDRARVRPRRGDGQLQPGDGLDRLRHVRPPVLRAAHARGRAGDRRGRAARGRDRLLRRPDAAAARRRPGGRRA